MTQGRADAAAADCLSRTRELYPEAEVSLAAAATDAGRSATAGDAGCPADARFEIGSLTKTFTATLLASLHLEGTLDLEDDLGRWIPAAQGKGITLLTLATHTSGLPRLTRGGLWRALLSPRRPYARYTARHAERDLRRAPDREPSDGHTTAEPHAYSNFGYQVLGLALERASGQGYARLLQERILAPLGMTSTGLSGVGDATRVQGRVGRKPAPHWYQPLPGAGAIESSVGDMARYLTACAQPPPDAVGAAIGFAQAPWLRTSPDTEIGLAWIRFADGAIWHNGRTGGFSASLAIDPTTRRGLTMLVGSASGAQAALDQLVLGRLRNG